MAAMSYSPTESPRQLIDQVRAAASARRSLRIIGGDTMTLQVEPK